MKLNQKYEIKIQIKLWMNQVKQQMNLFKC